MAEKREAKRDEIRRKQRSDEEKVNTQNCFMCVKKLK